MIIPSLVSTFTHQGFAAPDVPNHYNEDALVACGRIFSVIDGATDVIGGVHPVSGINAAAFLSQWLSGHIASFSTDLSLKESLNLAVLDFENLLRKEWPEKLALGAKGAGASVIVLRLENDSYSFVQLGDCVLLERRNARWRICSSVNKFHAQSDLDIQKVLSQKIAEGVESKDALNTPEIVALIQQARENINIRYAHFNVEQECLSFAVSGEGNLNGVEALLLLSDGMAWPIKEDKYVGDLNPYILAAEKIYHYKSCARYYEDMIQKLDTDPLRQTFLRFKHADDASAVLLSFE